MTSGLAVTGAAAGTGPLVQKSVSDGAAHKASMPKMSMPKGDIPTDLSDPPVAGGPRPAVFDLGDTNGAWYNTGSEVVGTRSLAVALMPTGQSMGTSTPTATTPAAPGSFINSVTGATTKIVGDGFLSGAKLARTMNDDIPALQKPVDYRGKTMGQLGTEVGANVDKMLDMARVRATAHQLLKPSDPRNAQVDALTLKFDTEMATRSVEKPFAMRSTKTGAELMSVLDSIRADNPDLLPVTATFNVGMPNTDQAHMASAIIWPDGASGMPFDEGGPFIGTRSVQLTKPGLYAFICKVHAYMIGAVVVADPLYPGVSLGKKLDVKVNGLVIPTTADVLFRLVQVFFIITNPNNWQSYSATEDKVWDPKFAPVPVLAYDGSGQPTLIPNLESYMKQKAGLPMPMPKADMKPETPGVGEVWADTQMEEYAEKDKPGAATEFDATTWKVVRKIAAPQIDMNNPHNMWTDKNEKYLYQTEWFSHWLNVFDKSTGKFIRRFDVGPSPTHVMTEPVGGPRDDKLIVALSGGDGMVELNPGGTGLSRRLPTGSADEPIALPHAQWLSGNGRWLISPNQNLYDASIMDLKTGKFRHEQTGEYPIATGMTADSTKGYYADILGQAFTCITNAPNGKACVADDGTKVHRKDVSLWDNYDPLTGPTGGNGFSGLPIQVACAPDNSACAMVGIFAAPKVTIFDPKTDKIVKYLPCVPGCHGVNFGAKKGGGYYAYVTSKFANIMEILDLDPNGDGHPDDAALVGRILTTADSDTAMDGTVTGLAGMGGEGILAIPHVYEGWVERDPKNAVNAELTCRQRHPLTFKKAC
ncbi:MAG TPA: copper oxidase [Sporichthyaceae bacterium]